MAGFDQSKLNELLSEEEDIRKRIAKINEQMATASGRERERLNDLMRDEREILRVRNSQISILKKRKEIIEYEKDAMDSLSSLSRQDLKNISGKVATSNILASVTNKVIQLKRRESKLDGDALERAIERRETLEELKDAVVEQSKSLTSTMRKEVSIAEKRENFERSIAHLTKSQKEEARNLYNIQTQLEKKEQRINAIYEQQNGLLESAPGFIKESLDFAQKLGGAMKDGLGPIVLLGSILAVAVDYFIKLQQAGEDFRKETGLLSSQTAEIDANVNRIVGSYASLGIEAGDIYEIVKAIKEEFSEVVNLSEAATAALVVMGKNFGVSAENAVKVQGVLENIGGLSSDTAANIQLQIADMAKLAQVAPDKVFADIAESAEIASTLFKGDVTALAKAAVEARRLGTNLKSVANTAEKLLEFESSIGEELEASAIAGGNFNLTQARSLAYAGDMTGMQNEILNQLETGADFTNQGYFAQKALANAAGMTVEEITKQLNIRQKLNSLSSEERKMADDAIKQGLDLTNISEKDLANRVKEFALQQEQQSTLTQIQNTFTAIGVSLGSILLPVLNVISDVFTMISQSSAGIVGFLTTMAALSAVIYANKVKSYIISKKEAVLEAWRSRKSVISAISSIFSGQGQIPIVGAVIAATMVGALFAAISKASSSVGDLSSPAKGKTVVSTKEGGLFELSPNDDLVAAPGLVSAMNSSPLERGISGNRNTEPASSYSTNVDMLLVPLNNLLVQIQGLRADLNAGKIAVNMDGQKVTSGISRVVDRSSTNSYSLG